ncbi:MAG: hypothetical protein V3U31_06500, partial [Dehalococcoidia bacterium]
NGWMTMLEEGAGEIITAVLGGTKHSIASEEQALLASWAAKTAVMIQYLNPKPNVPERRRRWLFTHQNPPPDTGVWLARYDGAFVATSLSKELCIVNNNTETPNCPEGHVVFFNHRSLMFVVLSLYLEDVALRVKFPTRLENHLFQIWPKTTQTLTWPKLGLDDSLRTALISANLGTAFFLHQPPTSPQQSSTEKG